MNQQVHSIVCCFWVDVCN